jgi:hypothetical protein
MKGTMGMDEAWVHPDDAPVFPRVRQGIEFTMYDDSNGELRITGDDDAGLLLWGAQWLDEHRDWVITATSFEESLGPGYGLTAALTIKLASPGTLPDGHPSMKPRFGPWSHGVPPMPV